LNNGKFVTPGDKQLIKNQIKQAKLQPVKERIKEAEKDKFWNDFHEGIAEKSAKVLKDASNPYAGTGTQYSSTMQATGLSYKNPLTANEDTRSFAYGPSGNANRPINVKNKKAFGQDRNSLVVHQIQLKDNLNMNINQNGLPGYYDSLTPIA
jgi:hypothetical protein